MFSTTRDCVCDRLQVQRIARNNSGTNNSAHPKALERSTFTQLARVWHLHTKLPPLAVWQLLAIRFSVPIFECVVRFGVCPLPLVDDKTTNTAAARSACITNRQKATTTTNRSRWNRYIYCDLHSTCIYSVIYGRSPSTARRGSSDLYMCI